MKCVKFSGNVSDLKYTLRPYNYTTNAPNLMELSSDVHDKDKKHGDRYDDRSTVNTIIETQSKMPPHYQDKQSNMLPQNDEKQSNKLPLNYDTSNSNIGITDKIKTYALNLFQSLMKSDRSSKK